MACCEEKARSIAAMSLGELVPEDALELLDHLDACAACSRELEMQRVLTESPVLVETTALLMRISRWRIALSAAAALLLVVFALNFGGRDAGPHSTARDSLASLAVTDTPPHQPSVLRQVGRQPSLTFQRAMKAWEEGELSEAARELEVLLKRNPEDELARLYLGIVRLQNGEPEAATELLGGLASKAPRTLLRERARWYLVQCWLLRENEAEARRVLDRLVLEAGDYELNAKRLLQRLEAR